MKARTSWLAISFALLPIMLSACGGTGAGAGNALSDPPPGPSLTYVVGQSFSAPGSRVILEPSGIPLGGGTSGPVVADFTGTGKLDIAVFVSGSPDAIEVFPNNGAGQFGAPIVTPVQSFSLPGFIAVSNSLGSIAVGDFNGDGKPDLVVCPLPGVGLGSNSIVLLGNGDRTFTQLPPIPNSSGCNYTVVADLNHDGHQDLVFAGSSLISVALGNGDGTFVESTLPSPFGPPPPSSDPFEDIITVPFSGLAVGDFHGTGKLDIAVEYPFGGSLFLYPGNGDGTFQNSTSADMGDGAPTSLANGDFFDDGKQDLLIGDLDKAYIALGNGNGTFQFNTLPPSGVEPTIPVYSGSTLPSGPIPISAVGVSAVAADLTGDGKLDVVTADNYGGILQIALNGSLGKTPPNAGIFQLPLAPGIWGLAVGDLDGDGVKDVIVLNEQTGYISVILSKLQ